MRIKRHRLTFRLELLEPVLSGSKVATIRFSQVAARVRRGDDLVLAFGAYHRPVIVEATAVRVETVRLEPELRRPHLPAALVEALEASGGDYESVVGEATDRGADTCTCVWFTGAQRVD